MPVTEDNTQKPIPDLKLAQLRFKASHGCKESETELLEAIKEKNMAPFYIALCEQLKWNLDQALLQKMQQANEERLTELQEKLKDAEENFGDNEVREACLARAQFFSEIGFKKEAVKAYRITAEKTVPIGQRLDVAFALIRLGFFHDDRDLIRRNIEKAQYMIEEGGDWDRKNRLKVYEAFFAMSLRQFAKAADLFLDTISTFISYELFDYDTFIFYTIITSIVSLPRPRLKSKVVEAPDVLSVIHRMPVLSTLLNSFYNSDYKEFFGALASTSDKMKVDRYLAPHANYFCREMRIRAYAQLLESYRSVQIEKMANQFGVSAEFLDRELSRFIASERLHCKIDKVAGIIETTRPDAKNAQYQSAIKQGDLLLNRIQKLSRVINI